MQLLQSEREEVPSGKRFLGNELQKFRHHCAIVHVTETLLFGLLQPPPEMSIIKWWLYETYEKQSKQLLKCCSFASSRGAILQRDVGAERSQDSMKIYTHLKGKIWTFNSPRLKYCSHDKSCAAIGHHRRIKNRKKPLFKKVFDKLRWYLRFYCNTFISRARKRGAGESSISSQKIKHLFNRTLKTEPRNSGTAAQKKL